MMIMPKGGLPPYRTRLKRKWKARVNYVVQIFTQSLTGDYLLYAGMMLGVSLLFIIGIGINLYVNQKQVLSQQLTEYTQGIEMALTRTLHDVAYNAEFIGDKALRIGLDKPGAQALFEHSGTIDIAFHNNYAWLTFNFITPDNKILVDQGKDVILKEYPLGLAKKIPWQLQVGDVYDSSGDIQSYQTLPVAMAITKLDGKYQGALIADISMARIEKNVRYLTGVNHSAYKYMITDQAGHIIFESSMAGKSRSILTPHPISHLADIPMQGAENGMLKKEFMPEDIHYTHFHRSPYSLVVVGGFTRSYLIGVFLEQFKTYMLLVVAFSSVVLMILYYFRKHIIAPILHLSYVAKSIRSGAKHIAIRERSAGRVKRKYAPEIHDLRVALARNIIDKQRDKKRQEILLETNRMLEERTEELEDAKCELENVTRVSEESDRVKQEIIESIKYSTHNSIGGIMVALATLKEYFNRSLIQDHEIEPEQMQQVFKFICREINHIQSFTSEQLKSESLDLKQMIEESVMVVSKYAMKHEITISRTVEASLPMVQGDRICLTQIIVGLLLRSLDFLTNKDSIAIYVTRIEKEELPFIRVHIKDTGLGWGEEERKASQKRYNVKFLAKEVDGTDLSMASVRALVARYNGTLECTDVVGTGSEVILILPYDVNHYLPMDHSMDSESEPQPKTCDNVVPFHRD